MSISKKRVVIYSDDVELAAALDGKISSAQVANTDQSLYQLIGSAIDTRDVADDIANADIAIYDLDLVNNQLSQATQDILHLKLNARSKPVFLTGSRENLEAALASTKIEPHVQRTIAKPFTESELQVVVQSVLSRPLSESSASTPKRKFTIFALGSASLAALFGSLMYTSLTGAKPSATASVAVPQFKAQSTDNSIVAEQFDGKLSEGSEISYYLTKAKQAMTRDDLISPVNANVLYYADKVLALEQYNNEAYRLRQSVLLDTRAFANGFIDSGDYSKAEKLINVLSQAEPFSDDNRRLLSKLNELQATKVSKSVSDDVSETGATGDSIGSDKKDRVAPQQDAVAKPLAQFSAKTDELAKVKPAPQEAISNSILSAKDGTLLASAGVLPNGLVPAEVKVEVERLVVIKSVSPRYPNIAVDRNIEGWVEVAYQVNETGKAVNLRIVSSEPERIFDKSTIKAMKKWRFEPPLDALTGKPKLSQINTKKFSFNLGLLAG